jgi:hypothetical protein
MALFLTPAGSLTREGKAHALRLAEAVVNGELEEARNLADELLAEADA